MDFLDRRKVQAKDRIGRDQDIDVAIEFACEDGALHVAAGEAADGGVLALCLDTIGRDPLTGAAFPFAEPQPAALGQRRLVKVAQGHVLGHAEVADAGIAKRLFGEAADFEVMVLRAGGGVGLGQYGDCAGAAFALAHQGFDQFALSVAGNAGDAEDFAGVDRQGEIAHGQRATVAHDIESCDLQVRRLAGADDGRMWRPGRGFGGCGTCIAHHGLSQPRGVGIRDAGAMDAFATAQDGHVVGIGHHFAELVRDDQDRAHAASRELAHMAQHFVGLLGCQYRGGLVQDQQARLEVELFEQFQFLFFTGGQLLRAGVQVQAERGGFQELLQFLAFGAPVDHGRRLAAGQQQVFSDGHARRQCEVLVDHADTQRPGNHRVGNVLFAAIDQDAAGFGCLESGDAFDQGALAGAVLAQQCVDSARADLHGDAVQSGKTAEAFGQLVGVQREGAGFGGDGIDQHGWRSLRRCRIESGMTASSFMRWPPSRRWRCCARRTRRLAW